MRLANLFFLSRFEPRRGPGPFLNRQPTERRLDRET
jgi:hypothetical protein